MYDVREEQKAGAVTAVHVASVCLQSHGQYT